MSCINNAIYTDNYFHRFKIKIIFSSFVIFTPTIQPVMMFARLIHITLIIFASLWFVESKVSLNKIEIPIISKHFNFLKRNTDIISQKWTKLVQTHVSNMKCPLKN